MTATLTLHPAVIKALEQCIEALDQAEDYFDNRSDADCDQDGFIPNVEMRILSEVSQALNLATPLLKQRKGEP